MKAPHFWQKKNSFRAAFLRPFGFLYEKIATSRIDHQPEYTSELPVICVGNATMGGSGKTPVVQALVRLMQEYGKNPAVLSRGYGGTERGPLAVDKTSHTADRVGDEALLHAEQTLSVISHNRVAGAKVIEKDDWSTHIIMDDGFQNPYLEKTLSFLVIDGKTGFGNERIFPAGPLREPVEEAIKRAQAIVIIGPDDHKLAQRFGFLWPVFHAHLVVKNGEDFRGKPVMGFAGIGHPAKFFHSLQEQDAVLVKKYSFGDHHIYSNREIETLIRKAAAAGAKLVTTRKDWVRIPRAYRDKISVLDVELVWDDPKAMENFLKQKGVL